MTFQVFDNEALMVAGKGLEGRTFGKLFQDLGTNRSRFVGRIHRGSFFRGEFSVLPYRIIPRL